MDGMNGTEAHDAPQPDVVAEMVAAALATRPTALRTSPYDDARQEAADDLELAAEWQMASDALAHDENQALTLVLHNYRRGTPVIAWLESQLMHERKRAHAAEAQRVALETERDAERDKVRKLATERLRLMSEANGSRAEAKARAADNRAMLKNLAHANERAETAVAMLADATREMNALRNDLKALTEERDTLAAKLDAAHARLAERENAALVADSTDVCAGFSAAALYRMYTLEKGISEERRRAVERLTARLNGAQIAADIGLDDAHEDDDDATPATLGDRRQQETRSIEWTPPTRSKPDDKQIA